MAKVLTLFKVKVTNDSLGRYNSHSVTYHYVACSNIEEVYSRFLSPSTREIEVVERDTVELLNT